MDTTATTFHPYPALFPELQCLVREFASKSARMLLARTCRREFDAVWPCEHQHNRVLLMALAYEGHTRLLIDYWQPLPGEAAEGYEFHVHVLHSALQGQQTACAWVMLQHCGPQKLPVYHCCLAQAVFHGCGTRDVQLVRELARRCPKRKKWTTVARTLATNALLMRDKPLLRALVRQTGLLSDAEYTEDRTLIDRADLAHEELTSSGVPLARLDWLSRADLLGWLQRKLPGEDVVHARLWLALLRDMVEQQWPPERITTFCQQGLGGRTLYAAFCVSPMDRPDLREVGRLREYMRAWAQACGNQQVLQWTA
jgi:hypothetical protein